jgi:hypothetical protein
MSGLCQLDWDESERYGEPVVGSLLAATLSVVAALTAPPGVAAHATVSCDSVAQMTGPATPGPSNRTVFGRIAVPARFLRQVANEDYPLRHWAKAGIHVRPGSRPVDLIVPVAWRNRLAIGWGDGGVASSLRITGCAAYGRKWLPYAGGFHLSTPACVPLIVRAEGRSRTMLFGIGRRCP